MNSYLIVKDSKFFFCLVTREIVFDAEKFELIETNLEPNNNFIINKWNGSEWVDGYIEVIEVPKELSRMKFKMQVLITTGKTYEEIIAFIQALPMSEFYKKLLLIRLEDCVVFERYSEDLQTIAQLMGITETQLDDIFINGNLIE